MSIADTRSRATNEENQFTEIARFETSEKLGLGKNINLAVKYGDTFKTFNGANVSM